MAGQGPERREILRILSLASAAAEFPGLTKWAFAFDDPPKNGLAQGPKKTYKPQFFTTEEYETAEILCDLIIPSDETPGAREAGVSEFIDLMASRDAEIQPKFRSGISWLDARSQASRQKPFRAVSKEEQTGILEHLAYREKHRPGEEQGRAFFNLIREYTLMGFYTSRIGFAELDNPSLRQFYEKDPLGCTHVNDREHKHLSPIRQ
ncbi:MAG TPA: gluconate 2-dehydrogenase subunit 3 family protein [Bryobacteraceae bacterium]|nr:gluconate 2-dehydrogenase subunit 3 family protein [Bryobacteraceae bacterium]